jgi:hypothetical protein
MPSLPPEPTLSDVPRLLQALRNHLDAANRHHEEADLIIAQLRKLLPPDSPLLDLINGEARN